MHSPYMNDFLIVVVVYEIELKQSITLQRLFSIFESKSINVDLLVYDNSKQSTYQGEHAGDVRYYKHDAENSGVAGAYNYALKLATQLDKKWLVLFDQDTTISNNYFSALSSGMQRYPQEKLFCATVVSYNTIVSPAYFFAERAFVLKAPKTGLLQSKCFTVINSGITVSVPELKALGGYDADLPLDFSDHNFFRKYKKANKTFVVIDAENSHNLSAHADVDFDVVFKRFKIYAQAAKIYASKVGNIFPKVWLWIRAMKLSFKFKDSAFVSCLISKR